MTGVFQFASGRQGTLLESLPPLLHLPAETAAGIPQLATTVPLILAESAAVGFGTFSARFTELVGEPPLQYLTRWRMTKAAQLLRERSDSVSAIAERVGYGHAAAFMKAFTRDHGISPSAYRRQHHDAT